METIIRLIQTALILGKLPCPFHYLTGYYCPGCGGTRAVSALIHGKLVQSFIQNPLVEYILLALIVELGLYFRNKVKISKGIYVKAYEFKMAWLWGGLVLMLVNFFVKNIALYNGFDIIEWATNLNL